MLCNFLFALIKSIIYYIQYFAKSKFLRCSQWVVAEETGCKLKHPKLG